MIHSVSSCACCLHFKIWVQKFCRLQRRYCISEDHYRRCIAPSLTESIRFGNNNNKHKWCMWMRYFFKVLCSDQRGRRLRATHHSGKTGNEFDAVLHLLLSDLHRCAVLLLQRKRIWTILGHPQMELQQNQIVTPIGSPHILSNMKLIRWNFFFSPSHLHFWDSDSCFRVFVQHPLDELLQLVTYQWPEKKVVVLKINVFLTCVRWWNTLFHSRHFYLSGANW